ncbi:MAG: cytochrome c, partial [Pseudomonadales bacterium]
TPDLTTSAFKKRLNDYPGVIVSSIILRPNGDLIPRTLRENGVKLSPFSWRVNDFRDLNQYMSGVILKGR